MQAGLPDDEADSGVGVAGPTQDGCRAAAMSSDTAAASPAPVTTTRLPSRLVFVILFSLRSDLGDTRGDFGAQQLEIATVCLAVRVPVGHEADDGAEAAKLLVESLHLRDNRLGEPTRKKLSTSQSRVRSSMLMPGSTRISPSA